MSLTAVKLCNRALAELGIGRIMDLTEDSEPARYCNDLYAPSRDSVLVSRKWNFSLKRKKLVELPDAPLFDYDHAFTLPPDCLMVWRKKDQRSWPWRVEGRTLVTDHDEALILYAARIEDPNMFSTPFQDALVARLAAELAEPLKAIRTKNADFWTLYQDKLQLAGTLDGQEGEPEIDDHNELADARFGNRSATADGLTFISLR